MASPVWNVSMVAVLAVLNEGLLRRSADEVHNAGSVISVSCGPQSLYVADYDLLRLTIGA